MAPYLPGEKFSLLTLKLEAEMVFPAPTSLVFLAIISSWILPELKELELIRSGLPSPSKSEIAKLMDDCEEVFD